MLNSPILYMKIQKMLGGAGMQINGISNTADGIKFDDSKIENKAAKQIKMEEDLIDVVKRRKDENKYTEEELIQSIESANEQFVAFDRRFEFTIHEKTKQIMVKIIDAKTDETIREIPPEKILDLVAALWEISGIIVDERI